MTSTEQDSSGVGRGRFKKTEKTRRCWTDVEEHTLLQALKELIAFGWKSDNGFRPGYLMKLEEAMQKEHPCTDLKAMPHINSKISIWKKNYYSLIHMLNRSGVGFNLRGNHMIDCDQEMWDQILKTDANARLMRFKSWPYLDDWKIIFGNDRATGKGAEDIMDAANDMMNNSQSIHVDASEDYHVDLNDIFMNNDEENRCVPNENVEEVVKKKRSKRKASTGLDNVVEILGEISRNTNARLETLANRIGYDRDLGKEREEVFNRLGNIPSLTIHEKFDICEILAEKAERLEIFKGLPDEARSMYVMRLLNEKNK